ncbi:MAG: acetoacetate decarboxylase family protein [Desulfobacterales bacterium]|nr:acetoacetate decarboxylase family protein [Desulfobacterales bacterium]
MRIHRHFKFTWFIIIILLTFLFSGCDGKKSKGTMYEEFDGILFFYQPKNTTLYRELLPDIFEMPDSPLVEIFIIDYYQMAPWAIKPYLEAAVFLLAKYNGQEAWHCITMPVTTNEARLGGIIYLGYPKVMGDISFQRNDTNFIGILNAGDNTVMNISLNTKGYTVTLDDKKWFQRLTGIPSLNILNGEVVNPLPGSEKQTQSILELSEKYPDILEVKVGKSSISLHPDVAKGYKDWKDNAFRIEPKKIILSYYFKSKYGFSFGKVEKVGDKR